ncbi:MAG TPA: hypothetical protein VKB46_09955 [Pyrinomonadaceae bacterium]|nr:hypothetical protein [Pyrinomonadaceae bacterium]
MNKQTLAFAVGTRSLGTSRTGQARLGARLRQVLLLCCLIALTTAGNCNTETLFKSNFDTTTLDQPPSATQEVGTASFSGPPGAIVVAAAPPNAAPPAKWLRITRPNNQAQVSSFQGKLVRQPGNGTYVFSSALFVPNGNVGPVTVQLEQFTQSVDNPVGFLHFDFLPDGHVRIDDDPNTTFGTFPINQVFLVQVTLTLNAPSASAHIILSGAGASGEADRTISAPFNLQAQQFGAVRLWIGFPNTGRFHAQNVVVTRKS